jgi:hypothetical protein
MKASFIQARFETAEDALFAASMVAVSASYQGPVRSSLRSARGRAASSESRRNFGLASSQR